LAQWEKLLNRITALPKDVRFAGLKKVPGSCGYSGRKPGRGSSRRTLRKPGKPPVTIPANEPVLTVWARMVKDIVEGGED